MVLPMLHEADCARSVWSDRRRSTTPRWPWLRDEPGQFGLRGVTSTLPRLELTPSD